jgi:N-acetylneuraminic acid mutarotase
MPTPRTGVAVAALQNEIFVMGGLLADGSVSDKVEIYDPQTDTWRESAPLYQPRHHAAAVFFDDRIWVIGGFAGVGFDQPQDAVWATTPDGRRGAHGRLSVPRGSLAAVGDGQPVAYGGATRSAEGQLRSIGTIDIYDSSGDKWFESTPSGMLQVPRDHLAAARVVVGCNDQCFDVTFVLGGRSNLDSAKILDTTEYCDYARCTVVEPMPIARSDIAAVAFPDGNRLGARIYVLGGITSGGTSDRNERYDPEKRHWRSMESMPTARHGLGAAVVGDTIYVIGGTDESGAVTGANEAFTP